MPTFDTPEPISVTIDLSVGDIRITASDRADTVVEIRPSNDAAEADVRAAEQTRVEYADGRLLVKGPKRLFGKVGGVDVTIALPSGSHLHGDAAVAGFRCVGRLGTCRIKASAGDLHLEETGPLDVTTYAGAIVVDSVAGNAEVHTGTGRVRVGRVAGTATVRNSNGDSWIGVVGGDVRVKAANGDITVDSPAAGVTATTANGAVRVGEAVRGSVSIKTACGELEVGIRAGTSALLDLHTAFGNVLNRLDAVGAPTTPGDTVEVRARTSYGDILIHRG